MAKLKDYLETQDLTMQAFGEKVGVSQSMISRLLRGAARPSWETVRAIHNATNGEVTANDWLDLCGGTPSEATE